jgi:hypothetical protein
MGHVLRATEVKEVSPMSEARSSSPRSTLGLPAALGLLAVLVAVAAFGVTSAFAADGTTTGGRNSNDPGAAYVQSGGDDGEAPDGGCPGRGSGSEQSSDA